VIANNSGIWNETGAAIDSAIAPACYQTAWVHRLVMVGSVSLIIILATSSSFRRPPNADICAVDP